MYASDYRLKARQSLTGNWSVSVAVCLVAALLGSSMAGTGSFTTLIRQLQTALPAEEFLLYLGPVTLAISGLFLVHLLLGGVTQLGLCRYLLDQQAGARLEFRTLFSQFHRYTDGLCLWLLQWLYILLWSLLFVIPGIVAEYSYAMAPFIMVEDPSCTAGEAIRRSREMMDGHKFDLFCLRLSFLGWRLLSVFTLGIGNLFLEPYISAATAAFYRDISTSEQ